MKTILLVLGLCWALPTQGQSLIDLINFLKASKMNRSDSVLYVGKTVYLNNRLLDQQTAKNPVNITQDATHRFSSDSEKQNWNGKLDATADEPGLLKFDTYAKALQGLVGRTKPARVLIAHDEQNNSGNFGKYDYDGTTLIEDVL